MALVDRDILVYRDGAESKDDSEPYALAKGDACVENLFLFDLPEVWEREMNITGNGDNR